MALRESPENPFASGGQLINPTFVDGVVAMQALPTGDLNDDGMVNTADVLIGTRILLGELPLTPQQQQAGDVHRRLVELRNPIVHSMLVISW